MIVEDQSPVMRLYIVTRGKASLDTAIRKVTTTTYNTRKKARIIPVAVVEVISNG